MSTSFQRLRLCDIRGVFNLVNRVLDAGQDPDAWRAVALSGMCGLIDGTVGISADSVDIAPGKMMRPVSPLDVGWTDQTTRDRYYAYYTSGESMEDPGAIALTTLHQRIRFLTRTRRQMVDDATWYASPSVTEARRSGNVDDFVCSTVMIRPGMLQGFVIYRPCGAKHFGERERRIARLFHLQILRLIDFAEFPIDEANGLPRLSPRLRQTLEKLLAGESVKQIAQGLGLSPHTVGDYVKVLYQKFDVCTRGELLSRYHASARRPRLKLPAEMRVG